MHKLQGLQIGDEVVFFLVAEHVFVGGHTAAAFIDAGADVGFGGLFAVGEFVLLEEPFQAGAHFLFVAIRIVADGALLENRLALLGVAFGARERGPRSGSQSQTKHADVKSFVAQNSFLPEVQFLIIQSTGGRRKRLAHSSHSLCQSFERARAVGDADDGLVENGHVLDQAVEVGAIFERNLMLDPIGEGKVAEAHALLEDETLAVVQ